MLGAIGGALSAIGSIGGMFGGSKKPPPIPPEAMWGLRASKDMAGRHMGMHDLLSQDFRSWLPEIRTGYDEYRSELDDLIGQFSGEGPLAQFRRNQLGKIANYDALESNLFSQAAQAGSAGQIAAKRNMARQDAMAGIGQLMDTTRSRQMAYGMGPASGGLLSPSYAARVGHQAGRQVYDAGEAERRYGLGLQSQLYPMAATGAQRAIGNYMLPAELQTQKAGTYAQQAGTIDRAGLPMNRASQHALLSLNNLAQAAGGVHQAQLEQFAMEQEANAGMWDMIGSIGGMLGGGGGFGDIFKGGGFGGFGGLGGIFGGGTKGYGYSGYERNPHFGTPANRNR